MAEFNQKDLFHITITLKFLITHIMGQWVHIMADCDRLRHTNKFRLKHRSIILKNQRRIE